MKLSRTILSAVLLAGALALAGCGGGDDTPTDPVDPPPDPAIAERAAIDKAIDTAEAAVAKVDDAADAATVAAADAAVMAASSAIAAAANVPDAEKAAHTATVTVLANQLDAAKKSRTAKMDDDQKAKDAAMMAKAMKLHTGIGAPTDATSNASRLHAAYAGEKIRVWIGTAGDGSDCDANTARCLSEDKKAMVDALQDWDGKQYTVTPTDDGTYTAVVYSNVGESTEGNKFGSTTQGLNDTSGFQYQLNAAGELIESEADGIGENDDAFVAKNVAITGLSISAGSKTYELPDPNPSGATKIEIPGSYHGVSGNYYCTPNSDGCKVSVASSGYSLSDSGDTWTFVPTDPNTKIMDTPDANYASYGWWTHESADGKAITASAFVDNKGTGPTAISNITALQGTATYSGGAAGQYALYSATGGTNDAGSFTANATLDADFGTDMISGTIDGFKGNDGMSRDWSVELKKTGIANDGVIDGPQSAGTVWKIGENAAAAAGRWSGHLQESKDDVPMVATGTFYSEYSTSGTMVGAFGANKD